MIIVEIIKNSLAYIHQHYGENFMCIPLAQNAGQMNSISADFLKNISAKLLSPISMNTALGAITLLQDTQRPVMDICLDCGFHNLGNF